SCLLVVDKGALEQRALAGSDVHFRASMRIADYSAQSFLAHRYGEYPRLSKRRAGRSSDSKATMDARFIQPVLICCNWPAFNVKVTSRISGARRVSFTSCASGL